MIPTAFPSSAALPREHEYFAFLSWLREGPAELRRVLPLYDDLGFEVGSGTESPIFMRRSSIAIRAGVEAAAIGIETPSKRQIGTLVPAENVTGRIVIHLQPHIGSRLQEISVPRFKRIRWIQHWAHWTMVTDLFAPVNGTNHARYDEYHGSID